MKQVVQNFRTGELIVGDFPPPALKPGGVLVRTAYSLISAGTERSTVSTAQSSLLGKARQRPDLVKQVINTLRREGLRSTYEKVMARLYTVKPLGYSSAGIVIEVGEGVDEFRAGDRVACAGVGYASHAEIAFVPRNLCVRVPDGVGLDQASYTTLGAIAMQGVRQAHLQLGEVALVIGLGLVGQLTVQLLKAAGCRVFAVDLDARAVELSLKSGADEAALRKDDVQKMISAFTGGRGADAVIITAGASSSDPVELAGAVARDRGRVVVVGAVKMDIPREYYYLKELELCLSRSYGPGRYDPIYEEKGIDYPIGYVRWTEKRNMEEFLRLLSAGRINTDILTTHRFAIESAQEAYNVILDKTGARYCGVLLEYGQQEKIQTKVEINRTAQRVKRGDGKLGVAMIGAGNFATATLLPLLRAIDRVHLTGVAASTGVSAKNTADRFKFDYCTSDYKEILQDENTGCVFIATRHNLHATITAEALRRGQAVFVEKPLALNEDQLKLVIEAQQQTGGLLMVGFNRRFSPLARQIKERFGKRSGPMSIIYRVNAGFIPKTHWIQDEVEGGGRIIGEVCHFLDLIQYFTEADEARVFAEIITTNNSKDTAADTVNINIALSDGSIATISYIAIGDSSLPKERIEIFCDSRAAIIDDFKQASFHRDGKIEQIKTGAQDKGHKDEIRAFIDAVIRERPSPIALRSLAATTLTTFRILDSIRTGLPVRVDLNQYL